jgi:actin-like ATPase involved in cell morphogenesis
MAAMHYQLGVDLGTTYTAAAVARDGRAEPVTLGTSSTTVPSVVFLSDDGGLVVGQAADRRAATDPSRVVREFKRRIGDPTPILVGGRPVAAELLMASVLGWVVTQVATAEGERPTNLVVTHPANWGPYKLDLLRRAIEAVRLRVDSLVPEPVAAATFYASQRNLAPGTVVAVYDLGGGTFDAAVVRSGAGGFEIIGRPDGIERLGGIDFDHAVLRRVSRAAGIDLDAFDPGAADPALSAALTQLRQECVAAKEALSSETDVAVPVTLPDRYTEVRLTRTEFEDMIRPALDETLVALRRAIASAQLTPADVSAVLLVGGSSRIPLVAQLVTADLGRPIAVDARPKDAISLGAALTAAATTSDASRPPAPARDAGTPPAAPPATPPRPGTGRPRRRLLVPAAVLAGVVAFASVLAWRTVGNQSDGDPTDSQPLGTSEASEANGSGGSTPEASSDPADTTDPEATGDPTTVLSSGADHLCALEGDRSSGTTVTCWGSNEYGQATPPAGQFGAIDAGNRFTCGILIDETFEYRDQVPAGPITCWGSNDHGQATPPQLDSFIRFSALGVGGGHGCALRPGSVDPGSDERGDRAGTLTCWGNNEYGQATVPEPGHQKYTHIAAGGQHTCVLLAQGFEHSNASCWGNDEHGQASPNPDWSETNELPNTSTEEFFSISAGWDHTCGVTGPENFVVCWGNDEHGQASPPDEQFLDVSAGTGFTCGIRTDNTATCWGQPEKFQDLPEGEFASVSAGDAHACGLRLDDTVACWGPGAPAIGG